jgi:Na+/proline symporter
MHPNLLPRADGPVDKDFLFPYFISTQFPSGMLGLIIAALFSASMSSLSAGINSVGSVITTDVLPAFFKNKSLSEDLKNIRMNSVIIGVFVVLLSLVIPYVPGNIVEVTTKTNGIFVAPLFNLFFMAFFVRKAKPFGVFMGSAYGLLTSFTIGFWDVLTGNMPWSFLWITLCSLLVSIISSFVFSIFFPSAKGKKSFLVGFILLIPWIIFYILII